MTRHLGRFAAACFLVATATTACSDGDRETGRDEGCSAASLAAPASGRYGLIEVSRHGKTSGVAASGPATVRVDAATGRTTSACSPSIVSTRVQARDVEAGTSFWADFPTVAGSSSAVQPDFDTRAEDHGAARGVIDRRTGQRQKLSFAHWRVLSVLGKGRLLLQYDAAAARGDDGLLENDTISRWFCVLPSVRAPRSQCRAVPDANGVGVPMVHPDGTVGWVPIEPVRAEFGKVGGWALTDGTSVVAFARTRSDVVRDEPRSENFQASADGHALLRVRADDEPLTWLTVERIDASGVHGAMQSSTTTSGDVSLVRSGGFTATRSTLYLLSSASGSSRTQVVWTVPTGAAEPRATPVRGTTANPVVPTRSELRYWPAPAGGNT